MKQIIAKFIADEQGQDIIEYALLGTFVSIAAYAGAKLLAQGYNDWFSDIGAAVGDAGASASSLGS